MGRYAPRHNKRVQGFSEGKENDGVPSHARAFIGLASHTIYIARNLSGEIFIDSHRSDPPYLRITLGALKTLIQKLEEKRPILK